RLTRLAFKKDREQPDRSGDQCDRLSIAFVHEAWAAMRRLRLGSIPPRPASDHALDEALDSVHNWLQDKKKCGEVIEPCRKYEHVRHIVRREAGSPCPVRVCGNGIQLLRPDGSFSETHPLAGKPLEVVRVLVQNHPNKLTGKELSEASGASSVSKELDRA